MKKNVLHSRIIILLFGLISYQQIYSQKLWNVTKSQSSIATNSNNQLLVWGDNVEGQLGLGDCMSPTVQNVGISRNNVVVHNFALFNNISFASIGETYGAVITNDGKLYVMGWNPSRQLGYLATEQTTNPENKIRSSSFNVANCEPSRILHPQANVFWREVAVGERYMVALDSNNQLYSWGRNVYGTLGRSIPTPGTTTTDPAVTVITNPPGVTGWKKIFGGYNHVLAISSDNRMFAWGHNYAGQLGNGNATTTIDAQMYEVPIPSGSSGWKYANADGGQANGGTISGTNDFSTEYLDYSLGITLEGNLYAWGGNENQNDVITGKLGTLSPTVDRLLTPTLIPLPAGATSWIKAVAGGNHALGITNNGKLYSWGSGAATGRGGNGTYNIGEVAMPTGVTSWVDVEAGLDHTLALGNDNKLYGFGSSNQGAIFVNNNTATSNNAMLYDFNNPTLHINNSSVSKNDMIVYYDHIQQYLHIKIPAISSHQEIFNVFLFDASGKVIYEQKLNFINSQSKLLLKEIPNGVYFIKVLVNGDFYYKKFIKK